MTFRNITCRNLIIKDGYKKKASLGLGGSDGMLTIFGDNPDSPIIYLGEKDGGSTMLVLRTKNDSRMAVMSTENFGGRFECFNRTGNDVSSIGVASDGGGIVTTKYKK